MKRFVFLFSFFVSNVNAQHWQNFSSVSVISPYSMYYDSLADSLYCGGKFINHQSDTVWEVAFWNGVSWETLCDSDLGSPPRAIIKYSGSIYIGGNFPCFGGGSLARFNGQRWDSVPNAPLGYIESMEVFQNNLYVGGAFYSSQDPTLSNVAHFDGSSWFSMFTSGLWSVASVRKLKEWNGSLYVGGSWMWDSLGDYIMRWTGTNWDSLHHGISPSGDIGAGVNSLEEYGGKLFIGGSFYPFNAEDRNIQAWYGTDWELCGGGSDGDIFDLAVFENNLYAVGEFYHVGQNNIAANYIARWDGSNWCGLGSNFNAICGRIQPYKGNLIVVGNFSMIDGNNFNKIAAWIGGNYSDTCSGPDAMNEIYSSQEFYYYPNPAVNSITIEYSSGTKTNYISIFDILGKKQIEIKTSHSKNRIEIFIDELAAGIYFVSLETENGIITKKFIKE